MATDRSKSTAMRRKPRQARSQERVQRILDVAERLFIDVGYEATTTNAIAKQAKVPIGSLYQFFPDKAAILQALALRYTTLFQQRLTTANIDQVLQLSLPEYVEAAVDTINQFFADQPGYHAIFMQVQGSTPEIDQIEAAAELEMIQDWAIELAQVLPNLTAQDAEVVAFVLTKAMGTLLWLSLSQEPAFRDRLVAETKRFMLSYLQSYV